MNRVLLELGSNIEPAKNILCAVNHLRSRSDLKIIRYSSVWQTKAVGTDSADFFNLAVLIETAHDALTIKRQVINSIENQLNRVRTKDKYAPRTIDIDIAIFNDQLLDENVYKYDYLIFPLAELIPQFQLPGHPTLSAMAERIRPDSSAKRLEGLLENGSKWPC